MWGWAAFLHPAFLHSVVYLYLYLYVLFFTTGLSLSGFISASRLGLGTWAFSHR